MTDELLRATVSVRGVIIDPRGRVLILQRRTDGEWELPGGRLATGEAVRRGLHRELTEETALSVEINDPVATNAWTNEDGQGRFAVHYNCSTSQSNVDLSDEHMDWEWLLPKEAYRILSEPQTTAVRVATGSVGSRRHSDQPSLSPD
ncbi:NUDIX domain-containing protein [Halorubrum sp. T3]|uniref:NUDIX domain-containing protein n=1 Tax=Halorubrum sp. T3 TaxID=1194088 RepID=UPI0003613139|nr:NUDIX domain-containing protein [Halorubrum sp. T3]